MSKVLVTGGAGFIGSHLTDKLIEKGHQVVVIDNLSTGRKENLNSRAKFYELDICDSKISQIFQEEKPEIVFHLAAQIDVRKSVGDPISDAKINILGTLNILENCRKTRVKKFIFASSGGAIYGDTDVIPTPENHPENPESPYGICKLTNEKYLNFYQKTYGLNYTALRLANVYGPRQNSKGEAGVIAIFTDKLLHNESPIIFGNGEQTRDFCVTGDTLILMDDFSWKPIRDIRPGEKVISFDEYPVNKKRRFKISEVKAISSYISSNVYEIKTEKGSVRATGNHPWLMSRRGYKNTLRLKENMKRNKNQKLRRFSEPVSTNENASYKIGYIVGSIEGDGHVNYYRYPNKSTIYGVGLGVTDKEFRDVVHSYFKEIGLNPILYERQSKYYPNSKRTYITQSNRKNDYYKMLKILKNKKFEDKNFCRGYLAAIFDSEGEFDRGNLRISNKSQSILKNIKNILRRFNFKWSEYNRKDGLVYIKILGGLNEHIRFFSFFKPKITRKRPKIETREVKGELVKIISISKMPDEKVYNLEINKTSTYIANGFLCHNTYVNDVVEAALLAMEKEKSGIYNIGTAKETSINEIFRKIKELTNSNCKEIHGPAKPGEQKRSCLDYSKAKKELNWQPEYDLEKGLKETINWFKNEN